MIFQGLEGTRRAMQGGNYELVILYLSSSFTDIREDEEPKVALSRLGGRVQWFRGALFLIFGFRSSPPSISNEGKADMATKYQDFLAAEIWDEDNVVCIHSICNKRALVIC